MDDPVAYIEDVAYRTAVLESGLVSTDNAYAEVRLASVPGEWATLQPRDPSSIPITVEHRAAALAGEPLVFDASAATQLTPAASPTTEAAWIALGRRVFFEYPLSFDPAIEALLRTEEGPEGVGYLLDGEAYVGLRLYEEAGEIRAAHTCAQCHVGLDPDGRLTGSRSNRAMDPGRERWLARSLEPIGTETNNAAFDDLLSLGPGRTDVLADGTFNPYAFPDLGGLVDVPYLHHNANWHHEGTATLALRCETLFITSNRERTGIPRVLSWAVATWIRSLPPVPPLLDDHPLRERGRQVFADAGCVGCHTPPLYTSDRQVTLEEVGTDAAAGASRARGTGLYRIPSLRGVGNASPYLHHGALDTLEAMFDPQRTEAGHPWGLDLPPEDRAALLGFLATL